jgi:hypothetical protein
MTSAPGSAGKGTPAMHGRPILYASVLALTLGGCQLTKPRLDAPPPLAPANPVALVAPQSASPAPIGASRALALLDGVCGAALPKFGTIDATMRANGITQATEATTMRSATEEVSFRLQDGPGDGKTCAMTFASSDGAEAVKAAFTSLGAFKQTPLGLATKYRGRPAIFIYDGPAQQIGPLQYYAVRLLSER